METNRKSEALAARVEARAGALAEFAATLSEAEWQMRLPVDGRKIGAVVHHVASMYPVEIHLASLLAAGQVSLNSDAPSPASICVRFLAQETFGGTDQRLTWSVIPKNMTDDEKRSSVPPALRRGKRFLVEDHAVRHSYHHFAGIRAAVGR